MVNSAAATVLPAGEFITAIPRFGGSTEVDVVHAHAGTAHDLQTRAPVIISPVTFVALLTTRPWRIARAARNPASDDSSIRLTSNRSSSNSGASPISETSSVTTTLNCAQTNTSSRSSSKQVQLLDRLVTHVPDPHCGFLELAVTRPDHPVPILHRRHHVRPGIRSGRAMVVIVGER